MGSSIANPGLRLADLHDEAETLLGYFLLGAAHMEEEIDGVLGSLERSLHALGYVG